ncbi:MAG: hypothetical protein RLZZ350_2088 [Verrucomicrobiota bacterium]
MNAAFTSPETIAAPQLVEELIHQAACAGASDIHLQMDAGGCTVAFRLDGLMTPAKTFPSKSSGAFSGALNFSRS